MINTAEGLKAFAAPEMLKFGALLAGVGTGNALDCSSPLNNTACSGYDAAYLTQQDGID